MNILVEGWRKRCGARKRSCTLLIMCGFTLALITVQHHLQIETNQRIARRVNSGGCDEQLENVNCSRRFDDFVPTVGLPNCPDHPPGLGNIIIPPDPNSTDLEGSSLDSSLFHHETKEGGWWRPSHCIPVSSTAVIIPYRDRAENLRILLRHLHPMLQRQLINYRVFVAEQDGNGTYNKGRIMNSAYKIIRSSFPAYDCFIFHDVDMVPEDDRNMYICSDQPTHLSPAVNKFNYTLPYNELVGGVLAIKADQFKAINGYANVFWGWGGEDDDMHYRLKGTGYKIRRPPSEIGRYTMLHHARRTWISHSKTYQLLSRWRSRQRTDGVRSVQYELISTNSTELYTHILIRFNDKGP